MSSRENLEFETSIESDSAALHTLVADMVAVAPSIKCLRDPTRGGLAATLNELARQSGVGMKLQESAIPIKPEVKAACELLGLDPLYVANEGKLICICPQPDAQKILKTMQAHSLGKEASIIGEVIEDESHMVQMETSFGGSRIVDWLVGEQLPRIC
jgi:hydrogenase expression/formation protein HypE